MLVACDVIRPAAIEQLKTLGESIGVEVFSLGAETKALETAKQAMDYAKENGYDTVLFDTAGRLHIDEELMQELSDIKAFVHPDDILLTVDAMTGQDIVNVAGSFHEQLEVTGLVLTKLDGDSRGGGILSVRSITQVPVKFVGLGEKLTTWMCSIRIVWPIVFWAWEISCLWSSRHRIKWISKRARNLRIA